MSLSLSTLNIVKFSFFSFLLHFRYPNMYIAISHCDVVCTSVMTNDFVHLFMCFLAICVFFDELPFQIFAYSFTELFVSLFLSLRVLYIFRIQVLFEYVISKCFLPVYDLCFHSSVSVFWRIEVLNFDEIFQFFLVVWLVFLMLHLGNIFLTHAHEYFLLFIFQGGKILEDSGGTSLRYWNVMSSENIC